MRKALKIAGIVLGALILIILCGAAYINFSGIPSYPTNPPDLKVSIDSAKIAEGKRISILVCQNCHMSSNGKMEGAKMMDLPPSFGKAWIPNITQHPESKLAGYTDGELAYLLRTGVKQDGSYAPPWMPKFPHLSDEDLHSVIAYLRSDEPEMQPSDKVQPPCEPSFLVKALSQAVFKPLPYPDQPIVAPPKSDKVAYGRYLAVGRYDCYSCHSADFTTVNMMEPEKSEGYFGGGNLLLSPTDGKTEIFTANLTMDETTGIGTWSEADFIKAVRFGQRPDGKALRAPMVPFASITEEEASAIWAYLQTVPKITNEVNRTWN